MFNDLSTIIAGLLLTVACGIATFFLVYNPPSDDPPCYFVVDRTGNEYPSYYPPTTDGSGAIYAFNDDHEWGYVFGPASMRVDRDCLRERGVDVPPLRKSEERP